MGTQPKKQETVFPFGMFIVIKLNGILIIENRASFLERDTMLFEIGTSLSGIPNKAQLIHNYIVITKCMAVN